MAARDWVRCGRNPGGCVGPDAAGCGHPALRHDCQRVCSPMVRCTRRCSTGGPKALPYGAQRTSSLFPIHYSFPRRPLRTQPHMAQFPLPCLTNARKRGIVRKIAKKCDDEDQYPRSAPQESLRVVEAGGAPWRSIASELPAEPFGQ